MTDQVIFKNERKREGLTPSDTDSKATGEIHTCMHALIYRTIAIIYMYVFYICIHTHAIYILFPFAMQSSDQIQGKRSVSKLHPQPSIHTFKS